MNLHFDVHDGDGPFLLLLHGMLSSRAQWLLNLEALSAVCRPVVAELWGHARSPSPEDPARYHPTAYAAALDDIRRAVGAERWFVCGQSFGAAITMRYALDFPGRVVAQVYTNSASSLADAATVAGYRQNAKKRAAIVEAKGRAGLEEIPVHPVHARRMPKEVYEVMVADARLHDPSGLLMTFQHTSPHASVRTRIHENTVPTLLVCGAREKRFAANRAFAEAHMPHFSIVEANAGHAVNIQAADIFNRAVADFIRRHAD